MERTAVKNSTQIASVGFDQATSTLEIEFKAGGVYQYDGVPFELADQLVRAESVGRFLSQNIRGNFPHRKVS